MVSAAGWATGARPGGIRCAGREGDLRSEVAKPSTHPGGGQPSGWAGPFPAAAQVVGEVASQAQLGVAGDDQPGPAVGGVRVTQLGGGPAQVLFEESEGVLEVEPAQERLPGPLDLLGGGDRGAGPQPQRFRGPVAGQVIDLQPDQCPLDDGSSPWWSSQAPRWVNLGCGRCQAIASAAPYPVVTVLVAWSAAARCRAGPDRAPGRAGTGG